MRRKRGWAVDNFLSHAVHILVDRHMQGVHNHPHQPHKAATREDAENDRQAEPL
jgi:hypothetical protein